MVGLLTNNAQCTKCSELQSNSLTTLAQVATVIFATLDGGLNVDPSIAANTTNVNIKYISVIYYY